MKRFAVKITWLGILATALVLTACGGGGGGGTSLPAAGVLYVGSTSQVTLDAASSEVIAEDIAGAELENLSGNAMAAMTVGISDSDGKAMRYAALERFKQDAFHIIEDSQNNSVSGYGHVETGNCGNLLGGSYSNGTGSATVLEQSSSKIVVKVSYNSLCETDGSNYAVEMDGDMYMVISGSNFDNASARVDSMRFYMPNFTVSFTDLTIPETTTATITEDWIIDFEYDVSDVLTGMIFSIAVNVSYNGEVYRFEAVTDFSTTTEKFYHPDYGYVEITVAGTFTYGGCASPYTPDGGSITITGDDGGGSPVTYEVTVTGCGTYLVVQL